MMASVKSSCLIKMMGKVQRTIWVVVISQLRNITEPIDYIPKVLYFNTITVKVIPERTVFYRREGDRSWRLVRISWNQNVIRTTNHAAGWSITIYVDRQCHQGINIKIGCVGE